MIIFFTKTGQTQVWFLCVPHMNASSLFNTFSYVLGYAPIPTGPQAAPTPAAPTPSTSSLQPPAGRGQSQRAPSPQGQRAAPVPAPRQPSPAAPRQPDQSPSPQKHPPSSSQSQKGEIK